MSKWPHYGPPSKKMQARIKSGTILHKFDVREYNARIWISRTHPMKNIHDLFLDALEEAEKDAHAGGLSLSALCRAAGVGRATPDRWRRNPPSTIQLLSVMQRIAYAARLRLARNTIPSAPPLRAARDSAEALARKRLADEQNKAMKRLQKAAVPERRKRKKATRKG